MRTKEKTDARKFIFFDCVKINLKSITCYLADTDSNTKRKLYIGENKNIRFCCLNYSHSSTGAIKFLLDEKFDENETKEIIICHYSNVYCFDKDVYQDKNLTVGLAIDRYFYESHYGITTNTSQDNKYYAKLHLTYIKNDD